MPGLGSTTAHNEVRHPLFARLYARSGPLLDRRPDTGAHREALLAGVSGRVVEVGAGTGLNFSHCPETVSELVAVEPERRMRQYAAESGLRAEVPVDVVAGRAEALPLPSGSFDAAVCSLVLCSLPDVAGALAEVRRVLRPGAELRFYEHGLAEGRPVMTRVQRVLDATVWPRLFGGCHTARDPLAEIRAAGFEDVTFRRVLVPARGPALPPSFHVLGSARRPWTN